MKGSQITRARGKSRKTIRVTIKKDLEINELDSDIIEHFDVVWSMLPTPLCGIRLGGCCKILAYFH
jgi:hypothetical protein